MTKDKEMRMHILDLKHIVRRVMEEPEELEKLKDMSVSK